MEKGSIRRHMEVLEAQGELSADTLVVHVHKWVCSLAAAVVYPRDAESLLQLYEASLGLEYLHDEGIVHGDLHGVSE